VVYFAGGNGVQGLGVECFTLTTMAALASVFTLVIRRLV